MKLLSQRSALIGFVLAALMAATRMHHFGTALHLPDASVAVFMLAGFFIASPLFFAGLLLEAGALDYVAITHLGVSDWCVTPAYWFLIPTYAVLWLAGRYYARIHQQSWRSLGVFSGIAFAAVSVAFFISNGAFYWFSGRYPNVNVAEYVARVAQYYPQYLTGGLLYLACAAALYAALSVRSPVAVKTAGK
ncbi:MAG: hypothetical protein K2P67_08930 [Gallionellaceae bacterium]|jgi:hypothetical protein|nr:hypothetical protein [Gallionellaceae bacterium]